MEPQNVPQKLLGKDKGCLKGCVGASTVYEGLGLAAPSCPTIFSAVPHLSSLRKGRSCVQTQGPEELLVVEILLLSGPAFEYHSAKSCSNS